MNYYGTTRKINLTGKEREVLIGISQLGKRRFTLDDLGDQIYPDDLKRTSSWREALAAVMRGLSLKLSGRSPISLRRSSKLGRGIIAEYELFGDLEAFKKEYGIN